MLQQKTCSNSDNVADNTRAILTAKKDERCEDATTNNEMDEIEQLLVLLDALFTYLNIYYPNDLKKRHLKL